MNALRTKKKKNDDDIATLSAVSKATSKKYLDYTGLGHLSSLIVSFVRNYAAAKTHNHDGVYAKSSHTHTTAQVTGLDSALAGKASISHNHNGVYAPVSHNHDAGAITSGILPIHRGGTGATNEASAANALGVYSLANKTYIPSGANLNTYKTSGTYVMSTDVNAATLQNCPTGGLSFTMWVDYILGHPMYIVQKVQRYSDGVMWHRESLDSGLYWSSWKVVLDSGNYNSYVPTKTGGGASGTWGINVTGSAGSVPWSGVTGKPSTFAPSSHSHDWNSITNKPSSFPATSHTHAIANITGLQAALDGKQPKGSYAAASHTHSIANITNLQSSLDGKAAVSHGHSAATTSAAGFMSAADKSKLDGVATGANKTIVDSSLSSTSVNPVQNKVVNSALDGKASTSHTHSWSQITGKPSIPSPLTCMPVGYVYISWSSTSPASLFGGSWTAITGRFPYFNAGTGTGGSNTHSHTLNSGYAKITSGGSAVLFNYKNVNAFNTNWAVNGSANGASSSTVATATTLGGNTDSNYHMPAYQTLYAWRRTA